MRMKRLPPSPYSRIEEIRESRAELLGLVVASVVLGILLSLLADWVYDYLLGCLASTTSQWLAFGLGAALSVLMIGLVVVLFHSRGESRTVRLEVAIPYDLAGSDGLEVAKQHRYRPAYEVARHARYLFSGVFKPGSDSSRELRRGWEEAKAQGRLFQQFMASVNEELVDALILLVLHRYGEDSLGPAAKYGWWWVSLSAAEYAFTDLPRSLTANRFLKALQERSPEWKLLLPRGVKLEILEGEYQWEWFLRHRWFGRVSITCYCVPWVAKYQSQPGRVLSEGIKQVSDDSFFVLGTRLQATAVSWLTFLPRTDPFHEWATGLLAYLEEALGWGYFLASRPHRMMVDVPWKLGDLPADASLWGKLEALEEHLRRIEEELHR